MNEELILVTLRELLEQNILMSEARNSKPAAQKKLEQRLVIRAHKAIRQINLTLDAGVKAQMETHK
jgi:hypothetical protein